MQFIKNTFKKINDLPYCYFLYSIPWVILCLLLFRYVIGNALVGYETNDDFYIEMITSGAYGKASPFTVYTNIVIGYVLVLLHKLLPMHNWFSLLQLGSTLIAFLAFGIMSIRRVGVLKGYLISAILLLCSFDSLVCRMNYSKTGAFLFTVGLVVFVSFLDMEHWQMLRYRLCRLGAFMLMLVGGLMRLQTALACIPFAMVMLVYLYLKYKGDSCKRLLSLVVSGALIVAFWIFNQVVYTVNSEWREFKKYDAAIIELLDYHLPEYESYRDYYEELGISENDYTILREWKNGDKEFYTIEMLQKLVELSRETRQGTLNAEHIGSVNYCLVAFAKEYLIMLFLLPFAFVVLYSNTRSFWYVVSALALGYGEIWALLMKGRLNERSLYIPMMAAFLLVAYFALREDTPFRKGCESLLLLLGVAFLAYYGCGFYTLIHAGEGKGHNPETASALLQYTSSHQDALYVMDIVDNSNLLMTAYGPLDDVSSIPHENIVTLGGWLMPTPLWGSMIEPFGYRYNLLRTLATKENVYLILPAQRDCLSVYDYIREHYDPDVQLTLIDQVGSYAIYQF